MAQGTDPANPAPHTTTRSQARKATFDRVVKGVMEIVDDDLLLKALDSAGMDSVADLITLTDAQIDALSYDDGTGTVQTPSLASRNKLRILRAWNLHLQQVQGTRRVDWSDHLTVNEDEWDEFRVGIYVAPGTAPPNPVANAPVASPVPPLVPTPRFVQVSNPASDFRRGNKRDKTHYREFKDESQWDEFKRVTRATIYAHGCENVINPSYVPSSQDDIVLFEEQQKFMYDVWATILKTPMGKHYVRLHESTRDAQAVWRDLTTYMRSSTRADIEIEGLMTTLTSIRLTSATKGNTQQFVLDWLDKLRIYEDLTPPSAHFPEIMKKAMLQNALNGLKVFRDVKTSEQLEVAKGQGPLTYQAYISLIQQVAASYDKSLEPQNRRNTSAVRQAHLTEFLYDDCYEGNIADYGEVEDDDQVDFFGSMSINTTQQQRKSGGNYRKRPSLPKAVWEAMSRSDQMAWDSISDQAKFKIIFAYKDHIAKSEATSSPGDKRRAQVHA